MGPELPLSVAFSKVEARSLVADAAVKVAVLSALRGLLGASDETFAGALSLEPSPGAVTVAPFAQTRLKRPAGADASAWAAREAELVAWFEVARWGVSVSSVSFDARRSVDRRAIDRAWSLGGLVHIHRPSAESRKRSNQALVVKPPPPA